jgi:alkylated DNA nucleotide flippase Atl1
MTKQELDRLAADNGKVFEELVVRMIVGTTMTYAEIARTVGLGSATEVGRIAKKHNVRRPKGLGSPAYKLTKNHPPKY